jgi:hypothetical protein
VAIQSWFRQFKEWLRILNITDGSRLWNVDESGLCDQPKDRHQVVGHKDETSFQVVNGEKGENHTILAFVSGDGSVCPPTMLVRGRRIQTALRAVCPRGMRVSCSPKGYISAGAFFEYAEFFVRWLKGQGALRGERHLILMDGHSSHLYNLELMELMRANNIEVGSLPPHTTHLIQPLDDVPFASLKKVWNAMLLDKNQGVLGRKLTKEEVMNLFMEAWNQAVTSEAVRAGFRNTGIWPANADSVKLRNTATTFINRACKWLARFSYLLCSLKNCVVLQSISHTNSLNFAQPAHLSHEMKF